MQLHAPIQPRVALLAHHATSQQPLYNLHSLHKVSALYAGRCYSKFSTPKHHTAKQPSYACSQRAAAPTQQGDLASPSRGCMHQRRVFSTQCAPATAAIGGVFVRSSCSIKAAAPASLDSASNASSSSRLDMHSDNMCHMQAVMSVARDSRHRGRSSGHDPNSGKSAVTVASSCSSPPDTPRTACSAHSSSRTCGNHDSRCAPNSAAAGHHKQFQRHSYSHSTLSRKGAPCSSQAPWSPGCHTFSGALAHALRPQKKEFCQQQGQLQRCPPVSSSSSASSSFPLHPDFERTPSFSTSSMAQQVQSLVHQLLGPVQHALDPLTQWVARHRDILTRLVITVVMLGIIRAGQFIALPGIDLSRLPVAGTGSQGEQMIKALYGQAKDLPASLFDLGISPQINASIVFSVLLAIPPELTPGIRWLERLREQRKEGKPGEVAIKNVMSYAALGFAVFQSVVRALELQPYALYSAGYYWRVVLSLVAGSCIIHHCAEVITESGLGNGSSLVICTGIISGYTSVLHQVLSGIDSGTVGLVKLAVVAGGYLGLVLFAVYLHNSELRLPMVQYSTMAAPAVGQKQKSDSSQEDQMGSVLITEARALTNSRNKGLNSDYFPLKLNTSGMMPMIIAGASYYGFVPLLLQTVGLSSAAMAIVSFQASFWGLLTYGLLVAAMEFLPLGGLNPKEAVEYFAVMNVGIRGVVPGQPAEAYLRGKLLRCKMWGGLALGGLAVCAQMFDITCHSMLGSSLATTSLLIIVGASLQTARQLESLLQAPKLQARLDQERQVIQSLTSL